MPVLQWMAQPLPWPFGYLPQSAGQLASIVFGLVLVLLGLLYAGFGLFDVIRWLVVGGNERGPQEAPNRLILPNSASRFSGGLVAGVALGLVGGTGFALVPGGVGRLVLPTSLPLGLAMGLGCGILVGCAAVRVTRLPVGLVLGASAGLLLGLVAFRWIFGPTAGFGPETDQGVGTEVGLVFGLMGGLAGALAGLLIGHLRNFATADPSPNQRRQNGLAVGLLLGAAVSLLVGLAGWLTGVFTFMLPYYGGVTDCSRPVGCPAPLPAELGIVYGLGLFVMGGALVGGLAGGSNRSHDLAGGPGLPWIASVVGLSAGLAAGLGTGLQHSDIGGPAIIGPQPVFDPMAGAMGLAIGLAGGLAVGILCAVVIQQAEQSRRHGWLVFGAVLILLGLVIWSLSSWYIPFRALDVP
ncbi:MAG: hypothetical protein ACLQUY_29025 [Ktedonobacterales bacterium]